MTREEELVAIDAQHEKICEELEKACKECRKNKRFLTSDKCSPCLDRASAQDAFFDKD